MGCLRYGPTSYGSGFRRAGLEVVRQIYRGVSMSHGLGRVTAREPGEAWPDEMVGMFIRDTVNTAVRKLIFL